MTIAATPREVLLALEPRFEAARMARRALSRAGLHEDVAHTVDLLTSELVTNALRHAGLRSDGRVLLFARLTEDFARVEVADTGPGFDPAEVEHGLGLKLLGQLAARWGVDRRDRGCRVWFEVDRRPVTRARFSR